MPLEKITQVTGRGVHIPGDDIDTDRIIPARYMKVLTFDELGPLAFHDARKDEAGNDKPHPLNEEKFKGARILISGSNFGCGSSREHAPQSLYRFGFKAILAESFAEIFFGNSTTIGMPCLVLAREDREALAAAVEADPALEIAIDIDNLRVKAGDLDVTADMPETARQALLAGQWDPIGELIENSTAVDATADKLPYV